MNAAFIFGQAGIALAAIFSMAIVHIQSQMTVRPPWYYFVAVWSVGVAASFTFSAPYMYPHPGEYLPESVYAFRFIFGIERVAACIYLRYRSGYQLPTATITRFNLVFGAIVLLVMGLGLGYRTIYSKLQQNGEALNRLSRQTQTVAVSDTARLRALQVANDSLSSRLAFLNREAAKRTRQIDRLEKLVETLTDLVIGLKKQIQSVGKQVERVRTNPPLPGFQLLQPRSLPTPIAPDRVKPVPALPVPTKRTRPGKSMPGKNQTVSEWDDAIDSTELARVPNWN